MRLRLAPDAPSSAAEDGIDRSQPTTFDVAADFFWEIDEPERPWIAAVDRAGHGLVQSSTRTLRGRKLFLWGQSHGGRAWQRWLSPLGGTYLEIQAGLARTQLEHLAMPAGARWSWLESYGPVDTDPGLVHGDWRRARETVASALEAVAPSEWFTTHAATAIGIVDRPPAEILHCGTGWGALEKIARTDGSLDLPGTPFDDDQLTQEQEPWVTLVEQGRMPQTGPESSPGGYQKSAAWRERLEVATDWLGLLHLGIARFHAGDADGAEHAWRASVAATESGWALRNLAILALSRGQHENADSLYARATELLPSVHPLVEERIEHLLETDRAEQALTVLRAIPATARTPRQTIQFAQAAIADGDLSSAATMMHSNPELPTLREGARTLDALWYEFQAATIAQQRDVPLDDGIRAEVRSTMKLPPEWDFRMVADATDNQGDRA